MQLTEQLLPIDNVQRRDFINYFTEHQKVNGGFVHLRQIISQLSLPNQEDMAFEEMHF